MKGKVKTLIEKKRCGFITGEDGRDYFFHISALENIQFEEITIGMEIKSFEPKQNPKGPRAEKIYV